MDESEVEHIVSAKQIVFWVRRLEPKLDPGDHSVLGEILLPQLAISVKVKKADYTIEELGILVQSRTFKITQVTRGQVPSRSPHNCTVALVDMREMRDYLFVPEPARLPDPVLIERLRYALRAQAAKEATLATNASTVEQVVHLAPLSPVANECWVFWESGRKLFYFASDIGLSNPAVWQHENLMARLFDLDQQVVVSHAEAPGSNRFLTRYQVSPPCSIALFLASALRCRLVHPPSGSFDERTKKIQRSSTSLHV